MLGEEQQSWADQRSCLQTALSSRLGAALQRPYLSQTGAAPERALPIVPDRPAKQANTHQVRGGAYQTRTRGPPGPQRSRAVTSLRAVSTQQKELRYHGSESGLCSASEKISCWEESKHLPCSHAGSTSFPPRQVRTLSGARWKALSPADLLQGLGLSPVMIPSELVGSVGSGLSCRLGSRFLVQHHLAGPGRGGSGFLPIPVRGGCWRDCPSLETLEHPRIPGQAREPRKRE